MILYVLTFILSQYRIVGARPVTIWLDRAEPALDSESFLQRNLSRIIWSCVSTVIICAWTSVHPNLPPPNKWLAWWNRLKIMFWMVIAPELVLAWASRQFFAAVEIRNTYNESRKGKLIEAFFSNVDSMEGNRSSPMEKVDTIAWPLPWHGRFHRR